MITSYISGQKVKFNENIFSGLDLFKSRNELDWKIGIHYTIGLGLMSFSAGRQIEYESNSTDGKWESNFDSYRLYGKGSYNGIYSDSGWNNSFAFSKAREFNMSVYPETFSNGRDGGILIRQNMADTMPGSPYIYFRYSNTTNSTGIHGLTPSNSSIHLQVPTGRYLRATKNGNVVRLYISTNGSNYTLCGEYNFFTDSVFIGMGMSPNNSSSQGNVLFTKVTLITDSDLPPNEISIDTATTITVPPAGITVRVKKPEYFHGLMFTIRNTGTNDYTEVKWKGVLSQSRSDCELRTAKLSGNGAQINNICTSKNEEGEMSFELKSQNSNTYSVMVEIAEWFNGTGCK